MKTADLPLVFLSFDEPWADAFFADLRSKAPHALRVHGVAGLDACHKAAARKANARWFLTVDCDTIVDAAFFESQVPDSFLNDRCRVEWASRNAVNGLTYGNGSIKCWPRAMVEKMRTHEAAPPGVRSIDHGLGGGSKVKAGGAHFIHLPQVFSRTEPAGTPFHAFRCGLREGARLATAGPAGSADLTALSEWARHRLLVWCSVGRHAPNGLWVLYGARLGVVMTLLTDWDVMAINDYAWFKRLWDDIVSPRLTGRDEGPDVLKLDEEVRGLGARIGRELGVDLPEFDADASRFVATAMREARSPAAIDMLGYMYRRGEGLAVDHEKARFLFEVGTVLNLGASYNNLARMLEEAGPEHDRAAAIGNYETAIALGDRFAPYHLAQLLRASEASGEDGPDTATRAAALEALSKERGFDPVAAGGG